nr:MAG TPA: hypothetical protein [Caudoviricetes sp.]
MYISTCIKHLQKHQKPQCFSGFRFLTVSKSGWKYILF